MVTKRAISTMHRDIDFIIEYARAELKLNPEYQQKVRTLNGAILTINKMAKREKGWKYRHLSNIISMNYQPTQEFIDAVRVTAKRLKDRARKVAEKADPEELALYPVNAKLNRWDYAEVIDQLTTEERAFALVQAAKVKKYFPKQFYEWLLDLPE